MNELPLGKVPWALLSDLLSNIGFSNKGILQNAELGVDVAVLDLQEVFQLVNEIYRTNSIPYFVYKADPITYPTPNPSEYLIVVNKNDLATAGAVPYGITVTMLLSPSSTKRRLFELQDELSRVCNKHKISILGGHTEITEGVTYPILSASMIGFVPPEYFIPRKPRTGDLIVCSGWVGAEGTGILLTEGKKYFPRKIKSKEYQQGIIIGKNIDISNRIIECNRDYHEFIHLVHDATEGGIFGALYECLAPQNYGCNVSLSKIPIATVTRNVSEILGINPYKLISSGAVLLICDKFRAESIKNFLNSNSMPAEIIGEITNKSDPILIDGITIEPPESDHIITGLEKLNGLQNSI